MHSKSMVGNSKHTDIGKAWQKTGLMTLCQQRYFRFRRGASHHHLVNLTYQNATWCHGPPKNCPWPTGWEPLG